MADLLSYSGNAGLGLGSSPEIRPLTGKENLDLINSTARDIMLLDNQRNMALFQQKVKDRDTLSAMIMEDQVSTGDILPQYQPYFDKAKQNVESAFRGWKGNFNDIQGFSKYKEAVTHLKDIAGHAQVNTQQIKQLQQQQAKETLPRRKEDISHWIDQQTKQDFWQPINPYQQLHDFNMDDILGLAKVIKTEASDPKNPLFKYDVSYVDYDDILRQSRNQYLNDVEAANSIDQFVDKFQRYNPSQQTKTLDAIDAQIKKYNEERGFMPGQNGFVVPVKRDVVNGQILIREPKTEFAAKYALANQTQFMVKTPKFQKDLSEYALKKEKLAIDAQKLGIERAKADAYVRHANALSSKITSQLRTDSTNIIKQYGDFINAIQPSALVWKGSTKGAKTEAIFLDDLPQGYQFINGPVADTKTGKVKVGRLEPFKSTKGRPYYLPKYVNPSTGESMGFNNEELQNGFKQSKKAGLVDNFNDYIRALLKKGSLELVLKGANGAANYTSMFQSAKLLNAEATTKGEENIINAPTEGPEQQQTESNQ